MKQIVFDKINKHENDLRRSNSHKWVLDSISLNPNVIIVCAEDVKQDWIEKTKGFEGTEIVSVKEDLTELNLRGKPIIFDSHLVIH